MGGLEAGGGLHQADMALLDQVGHGQAVIAEAAGDGDGGGAYAHGSARAAPSRHAPPPSGGRARTLQSVRAAALPSPRARSGCVRAGLVARARLPELSGPAPPRARGKRRARMGLERDRKRKVPHAVGHRFELGPDAQQRRPGAGPGLGSSFEDGAAQAAASSVSVSSSAASSSASASASPLPARRGRLSRFCSISLIASVSVRLSTAASSRAMRSSAAS